MWSLTKEPVLNLGPVQKMKKMQNKRKVLLGGRSREAPSAPCFWEPLPRTRKTRGCVCHGGACGGASMVRVSLPTEPWISQSNLIAKLSKHEHRLAHSFPGQRAAGRRLRASRPGGLHWTLTCPRKGADGGAPVHYTWFPKDFPCRRMVSRDVYGTVLRREEPRACVFKRSEGGMRGVRCIWQ